MVPTVGSIRNGECTPLSVEVFWEIDNFHLQLREWGTLESNSFPFEGHRWSLSLMPAKTMHAQNILQSLSRIDDVDTSRDVPFPVVQWSAGIVLSGGQRHHTASGEVRVDTLGRSWTWTTVAVWLGPAYSELFGEKKEVLMPGGRVEVTIRLSVDPIRSTQTDPPGLATLGRNLKNLYVTGKKCDVTLKVRDRKFNAHRLILGARTPVLSAMFTHNMAEAESGIVCMEDCNPEAFEVFLLFVYSGMVENLSNENVTDVYYIADKYDLPELREECVRHMLSTLSIESVCSVLVLADRHNERILLERAIKFVEKNEREVFGTHSWMNLVVENKELAQDLLMRCKENCSPRAIRVASISEG